MNTETWHDFDDDGNILDTWHAFDTHAGGRVVISQGNDIGDDPCVVYVDVQNNHFLTADEANELGRLLMKVALESDYL